MSQKIRDNEQVWFETLTKTVTRLVEYSTTLEGNPHPKKRSGYLSLISYYDGRLVRQEKIGLVPEDKNTKYQALSEQKGINLLTHSDHVSSHQSRNPTHGLYGMWGGAIRAISYAYGFSGLDELVDEAVVTATAYFMHDLTMSEIDTIKRISSNPFIDQMIAFVDDVLRLELDTVQV